MPRWLFLIAVTGLVVGGLFLVSHKIRSQRSHQKSKIGLYAISPTDDVQTMMQKLAEQAVLDARTLDHIQLDYSPESIEHVEQILDHMIKLAQEKSPTEQDLMAEGLIYRAYIGEVIRRNYGGTWATDHPVAGPKSYPLEWSKSTSFPCAWCYKRLKNGPEDNVWLKYRLFVKDDQALGTEVEKVETNLHAPTAEETTEPESSPQDESPSL